MGPLEQHWPLWSNTASFGPLAQLVEQVTLNHLVEGSSPSRPTSLFARLECGLFYDFITAHGARSGFSRFTKSGVRKDRINSYNFRLNICPAHRFRSDTGSLPAKVAELVDALALGASGVTRESSSLSFRTRLKNIIKSVD
jgi:hypothetical protein